MTRLLDRLAMSQRLAGVLALVLVVIAISIAIRVVQSIATIDDTTNNGIVWAAIALLILLCGLFTWGAITAFRYATRRDR